MKKQWCDFAASGRRGRAGGRTGERVGGREGGREGGLAGGPAYNVAALPAASERAHRLDSVADGGR